MSYLLLDGDNDYVSTADKAAIQIADDLEVIGLVALDSYTTAQQDVVAKVQAAIANNSWRVALAPTPAINFYSSDGTNEELQQSPLLTNTPTNGQHFWIRVTFAAGSINYYSSLNGLYTAYNSVSWTGEGSDTNSTVTSLNVTDGANLAGGASDVIGGFREMTGKLYGLWVLDTGSLVAEYDARNSDWTTDGTNTWAKQGNAVWVANRYTGGLVVSGQGLRTPNRKLLLSERKV